MRTGVINAVVAAALLSPQAALANPMLDMRAINCKKPLVKDFASAVKKVAGPAITPFCSSYLNFRRTKTVTQTDTYYDYTYREITSGIITYADFSTTYIPVATSTFTYVSATYTGSALPKAKRVAAPALAPAKGARAADAAFLKAGAKGGLLGFPSSAVSEACSCLVTGKPGPTITITKATTVRETDTVVYPSSTTTATFTITETYTSYVPKYLTSTYTVPATCADAKPTFYAQLQDVDPAKGDQFNGQYLAGVTFLKPEEETINYVRVTSDRTKALLFTLDSASGAVGDWPRGHLLNTGHLFDFTLISLNSVVSKRGYYASQCSLTTVSGVEYLDCKETTGSWPLTVLQTCPLYQEYYDTPLVLGQEWSAEAPECFRKRIKVIRACTPKK